MAEPKYHTPIDSDYIERAIGPNGDLGKLRVDVANLQHGEMAKLRQQQESDRRVITATFGALERRIQVLEEAARMKAAPVQTAGGLTAVKRDSIQLLLVGGNALGPALSAMLGTEHFLPYSTKFEEAHKIIGASILYDMWFTWASIMRFRDSLSEGWDA